MMARDKNRWPTSADGVWFLCAADGWRLGVHVYGDADDRSRQPVILVHGALTNSRCFDLGDGIGLAPALRRRGYTVFAIDLRGRGWSAPESRPPHWTIDDFVTLDLPAVLNAVRERSGRWQIDVIGHSMGGIVTFAYLALGGDGVRRFVSVGSTVRLGPAPVFEALERAFSWRDTAPLADLSRWVGPLTRLVPQTVWRVGAQLENIDPALFVRLLRVGTGNISIRKLAHLNRMCRARRLISADGSVDYHTLLERIVTPILLVGATRDEMVPAKLVKRTAQLLVNAPTEVVICDRACGFSADYGHTDLLLGRRADDEVFPRIAAFLCAGATR